LCKQLAANWGKTPEIAVILLNFNAKPRLIPLQRATRGNPSRAGLNRDVYLRTGTRSDSAPVLRGRFEKTLGLGFLVGFIERLAGARDKRVDIVLLHDKRR
jgi:hypothetical protein